MFGKPIAFLSRRATTRFAASSACIGKRRFLEVGDGRGRRTKDEGRRANPVIRPSSFVLSPLFAVVGIGARNDGSSFSRPGRKATQQSVGFVDSCLLQAQRQPGAGW